MCKMLGLVVANGIFGDAEVTAEEAELILGFRETVPHLVRFD